MGAGVFSAIGSDTYHKQLLTPGPHAFDNSGSWDPVCTLKTEQQHRLLYTNRRYNVWIFFWWRKYISSCDACGWNNWRNNTRSRLLGVDLHAPGSPHIRRRGLEQLTLRKSSRIFPGLEADRSAFRPRSESGKCRPAPAVRSPKASSGDGEC